MKRLSRRDWLKAMGAGAAALAAPGMARAAAGRTRPNLIFILADDLGWRDTSLYGSPFCETPQIERLARRGMTFSNAYAANPLCSPTRASILTGLHPARIGITAPACHLPTVKLKPTVVPRAAAHQKTLHTQSATRLSTDYHTLPETLQAAGYRTGHFGKWHLGPEPYDPLHHGYDVDVPHWPGPGPAGSYLAPWRFPAKLNFQGKDGEHIEDRMGDEAIKFLKANKDRPFLLSYWQFSVHSPWDAKPDLVEKYRKKAKPGAPQRNPVYGAMVQSLDENVGRLIDTVDELGLTDNTIIVFFSDNGGVTFAEVEGAPVTSNSPLRGGKATIYEGGTREPCIVVWPGVVKPNSKSDALIQSIDFYPTILEMLDLRPRPDQRFDGISILPALKGRPLERDTIFCYFPHNTPATGALPSVYVRQGDWKLIRFFFDGEKHRHRYELYNLKDDLGEKQNLAEKMSEKVKVLDALIDGFLKDTDPVLPQPNPAYNPDALLAVQGWKPSADCRLIAAKGVLRVESTGKDPYISNHQPPTATGELVFSVRMRSSAKGGGQFFWNDVKRSNFNAGMRLSVPVQNDNEWHDYKVPFTAKDKLKGLRLDHAAGPGMIDIEWIRLEKPDGALLKEWNFAKATAREARPVK